MFINCLSKINIQVKKKKKIVDINDKMYQVSNHFKNFDLLYT